LRFRTIGWPAACTGAAHVSAVATGAFIRATGLLASSAGVAAVWLRSENVGRFRERATLSSSSCSTCGSSEPT